MDELAKRISELADKYGPNVIEAARGAARIEGYSSLASTLVAGLCAFSMLYGARWLYKKYDKENWDEICMLGVILLCGFSLIPLGMLIWGLIDPWVWTAINNPDLYIAKRVLKL